MNVMRLMLNYRQLVSFRLLSRTLSPLCITFFSTELETATNPSLELGESVCQHHWLGGDTPSWAHLDALARYTLVRE